MYHCRNKKKKMEDGGQKVDLPPDIMHDIFSRLPAKPLCRFKCVSKPWRSMISDPVFVDTYNNDVSRRRRQLLFFSVDVKNRYWLYSLDLNQYIYENHNVNDGGLAAAPSELDFVYNLLPNGELLWVPFVHYSCHGLFLSHQSSGNNSSFSLFNPETKESKKLPDAPIHRLPIKPKFHYLHLYGVGFDYSTNQYKVINGQEYIEGVELSVYTLQTGSWRKIEHLFPYIVVYNNGILVNGALHWLARKVGNQSFVIMSFSLAEEKVTEIALPPNTPDHLIQLGAFRDWLCITSAGDGICNKFWVMKEYGVRESWTQMQFPRPYHRLSHSGFWTETHDLMVFNRSSLVMFNFNDGEFWTSPTGIVGDISSIGVYMETLPTLGLSIKNSKTIRAKEDESSQ